MQKGFERYLLDRGKSANTIKSYVLHVNGFIKWHSGSFGVKPQKLRRIAVLDYMSYLRSVKKAAPRTINAKVHALVMFNSYLIDMGIQDSKVIGTGDRVEQDEKLPVSCEMTKKSVDDFLRRLLRHEKLRDYVLALVLAYTGLRISEALDLKISDVDFENGVLLAGGGGRMKQRRVPADDRVIKAIGIYIKEVNDLQNSNRFIFGSRQGERLGRTRVNQIFSKHSDSITPERLRSFYYTSLKTEHGQ